MKKVNEIRCSSSVGKSRLVEHEKIRVNLLNIVFINATQFGYDKEVGQD